ncbi:MAG TPA: regulatory iron-sulfur-containing complex subunit RicT [Melioribacteraceae bacterium]|nr:regulatory iron-sulfur-containing complex subunit RicT [Melioribacteraceae bacterium]
MYHIDLSFLKNHSVSSAEEPSEEKSSNNLYESLIVGKINQHLCNKSGCFFCYSEIEQTIPIDERIIAEVECNGLLNCNYCLVQPELINQIFPEDFVIVKNEDSFEIAQIKLIGEIVRLKRHAQGLYGEDLPLVVRKAAAEDLERVRKNLHDEERAVPFFRTAINKFNLNMKLVDIHFQFDRKKLFFFYTADGRIDFRELAKELASEFKTRIELRQIGVRDEAKRIGGVGTCGREYCCNSFLSSFRRITTHLATDQNLLSSMGKLSGPCNKLKCCLSFEIE